MSKPSACLIFNPFSGSRDPQVDLYQIRLLLEDHYDLELRFIQKDLNGSEIAQAAVAQGIQTIIAAGGDGTISAVAGPLVGTDVALGIIPRGTANALATALGIPNTITGACLTILQGHTRYFDAAQCNNQSLLVQAGIGFAPDLIYHSKNLNKKRWGILAYAYAGFQQWRNLRFFAAQLKTDEGTINCRAVAITVANITAPLSILAQGTAEIIFDDGYLDVTVFQPLTSGEALIAGFELFRSTRQKAKVRREDIISFRTQSLEIYTEPTQELAIDGDVAGQAPVKIQCFRRVLKLFVPER
jgi:YegS/Rv2252/BmrU family lipid kinase